MNHSCLKYTTTVSLRDGTCFAPHNLRFPRAPNVFKFLCMWSWSFCMKSGDYKPVHVHSFVSKAWVSQDVIICNYWHSVGLARIDHLFSWNQAETQRQSPSWVCTEAMVCALHKVDIVNAPASGWVKLASNRTTETSLRVTKREASAMYNTPTDIWPNNGVLAL